ncbi:stage II sporulation protein M [Flavobacterium soli]|uniref:stage II sporulation protein M n=1 Tax=Flavobacterium soli TaxID=344881 RepID=UPI00041BAAF8|nr:stage II sporulation protein M [Flavobacterium soli]
MREVAFIKQNKEKWLEFEQAIFGKAKKNPDEMAGLYIHLINDLSYAQTYYPKSKTVVYLNYLASQIYQRIYKTKRQETNRIVYFFSTEIPLLIYQYRRYVLYAFVLFFVFVGMGVLSAKYDDGLARLIMGDEYVNQTLENIKGGDPVAIYKSGSNWGSFIGITMNNLKVGAMCFLLGILAGVGTFYIMLQNCLMLGSFQYFFYQEGVFWESVQGIWIHGSMEIFAIVIEAAAGLLLGASLLFPKTYSRLTSLKMGMKNGLKIYLSTIPFTIAAGFLEGFVTRYSLEMPNWLNVFIILSTLSLISFYYLIFPSIVAKKLKSQNSLPSFE